MVQGLAGRTAVLHVSYAGWSHRSSTLDHGSRRTLAAVWLWKREKSRGAANEPIDDDLALRLRDSGCRHGSVQRAGRLSDAPDSGRSARQPRTRDRAFPAVRRSRPSRPEEARAHRPVPRARGTRLESGQHPSRRRRLILCRSPQGAPPGNRLPRTGSRRPSRPRSKLEGGSRVDRFREGQYDALAPKSERGLPHTGVGAVEGSPEEGRFARTGVESGRGHLQDAFGAACLSGSSFLRARALPPRLRCPDAAPAVENPADPGSGLQRGFPGCDAAPTPGGATAGAALERPGGLRQTPARTDHAQVQR